MSRTRTTIKKLTGYVLKPAGVYGGIVRFTEDGVNEALRDRKTCEAYGYFYDETSSTCYAYKANMTQLKVQQKQGDNNVVRGGGNVFYDGVNNTTIQGGKNTLNGLNRNDILIGDQNTIASGVNNSLIIGELANVTTNNSLYIGANQPDDNLGERQTIILSYGCQSTGTDPSATAGGTVSSGINNIVGTRYVMPDNSICYFHADTIAVRTGGTAASGAVGDFYSAVERGVIINKSGTCTISRERDTIKTSGTVTNWRVNSGVGSGNTLAFQCRGNNDMTIEWNITVTITMIQTSVSL